MPPAPKTKLTAVTASVLATPEAVLADDGRQHLAYELTLSNRASTQVTVRSIKVLAGKKVVGGLSGKGLAAMMSPFAAGKLDNKLQPGQGAYVLMDVSLPAKAKVPKRTHPPDLDLDRSRAAGDRDHLRTGADRR